MQKRVLAISYSQTGQLDEILDCFLQPFDTEGVDIDRVKIAPQEPFPFPWTTATFFDTMPETVLETPSPLAPFSLKYETYDLIVLGYQPWYLSPSIPTTALFQEAAFTNVLKDTPVATVIGARNMWLNSQERVVEWVENAGGYMVANVPFIDKTQNHISALTILHWMLTGKKTRKWGLLPTPGVAKRDIEEAVTLGQPLAKALLEDDYTNIQQQIIDKGHLYILPSIMLIEGRAKKLFLIWANIIKKKTEKDANKRSLWVSLFKWYLVIALFIISPFIVVIYNLIVLPLTYWRVKRKERDFLFLGIQK